jgi:16S rRNA (cytidine1402-2'-O)-methyltransferase
MSGGALYVVATPIGALDDITHRAVKVLKEVDLILCEDTRKSRILLNRWEVKGRLMSLHRFTEAKKTAVVLEKLQSGMDAALITDAGTPGISDPGHRLVAAARDAGFRVSPVPGPSSITAALSASGMDASSFVFLGFAPRSADKRRAFFEQLVGETRTAVFFETAVRIISCLEIAAECLGERRAVLWREMTKMHEEAVSGTLRDILGALAERPIVKGEMVVVVEGAALRGAASAADVDDAVRALMHEGFTGKRLAVEARRRFGIAQSDAYRRFLLLREMTETPLEETQQ